MQIGEIKGKFNCERNISNAEEQPKNFDFLLGGDQCPGFLFRNVFCHQSGEGMIDESHCTEDVAGEKPSVAKACDDEEGSGEESLGPQVRFF